MMLQRSTACVQCSIFLTFLVGALFSAAAIANAAPPPAVPVPAAVTDGGMPPAAARAAFDTAMDLVGRDDATAAARLESLADADPGGEYADDALVEAAQLLEEKLGHPDRARDLYARLLSRSPHSRLALRARARLDFLESSLGTGAAPLAAYQRILYGFSGRPPAESAKMMEDLLAAHPDFSLADKALLWLANLDAREGKSDPAERRYLEIERRFPTREGWALARKGRADLALAGGHPWRARALYQSILDSPDSAHRPAGDAARAGLRLAATAIRRAVLFAASLAWLIAFFAWALLRARVLHADTPNIPGSPRRTLFPLPTELLFYLPVAALFVLCAATENRSIAIATSLIATGGAAILLLTIRASARAATLGNRLLFACAVACAVLALTYAALYGTSLLDFVVETLRSGPER